MSNVSEFKAEEEETLRRCEDKQRRDFPNTCNECKYSVPDVEYGWWCERKDTSVDLDDVACYMFGEK